VDSHVYWATFGISGRRDTPMVDDPLHLTEVKSTRSVMEDKPHTVSEANDPFSFDYESEFIPILTAYGAFQNWDDIFVYLYIGDLRYQRASRQNSGGAGRGADLSATCCGDC
jgi:hypothetical protein